MTEKRHPLEDEFRSIAEHILDAILAGNRAKVDVKGKLAELYLNHALIDLKKRGLIEDFRWHDEDSDVDFSVNIDGVLVRIECKNIRSLKKERPKKPPKPGRKPREPRAKKPQPVEVELQKTRNSKDGKKTRGYKRGYFDVLAVSLFNRVGEWRYLYIEELDLAERPGEPEFLKIYQPVPVQPEGRWSDDLLATLKAAAGRKAKA